MGLGIKLNIRYLIYSFVGIISHIIRRIFSIIIYEKSLKKVNVAVCGRGPSANIFFDKKHFYYSKTYLANYCSKDLKFRDYFKFKKKDLVLVANICEPTPNFFLMLFNKISEVIISRPNEFIKKNNKSSLRGSYSLNALGIRVRGLKNAKNLIDYPMNLGNTGIMTIYEAAEYSRSRGIREISLFGFDFYTSPRNRLTYLRDEVSTDKEYKEHRALKNRLSKSLDKLVSFYPEIYFINYSHNNYEFKSENLITKNI